MVNMYSFLQAKIWTVFSQVNFSMLLSKWLAIKSLQGCGGEVGWCQNYGIWKMLHMQGISLTLESMNGNRLYCMLLLGWNPEFVMSNLKKITLSDYHEMQICAEIAHQNFFVWLAVLFMWQKWHKHGLAKSLDLSVQPTGKFCSKIPVFVVRLHI